MQDHPKSEHGIRRLTIPDYLVARLRERTDRQRNSGDANPRNLIFPSSTGTLCDPNNAARTWHKAAEAASYGSVTLKTFRKANATLIARTLGAEAAAAYQARHSKVSMTMRHYVEGYKDALDTRAALGAFSPEKPWNVPVRRPPAKHKG